MNLKKVLTENSVKIGLPGTTKDEIINELVDIIVANDAGLDRNAIYKAVLERESQMSTGMKNGIAIPHGKTNEVSDLHAVIAVSSAPVDFDCMDKRPARIFIMTISPASQAGPHLQFLAEVSGLLTKPEQRDKILKAKDASEVLAVFLGGK